MKTVDEILLANEERLLLTAVRSSPDALSSLIADDFFEIGSSGKIYTKQEVIEVLKNEPAFEGTISDFRTVPLTKEIVLVTYRMEEIKKTPSPSRTSARSSIWKKVSGEWKIIFHQGTVSTNRNPA